MTLIVASIIAGVICIALTLTAERWLLSILNILDKVLAALGVGTWSARILTNVENWVAERTARRAAK